MPDLSKLTGQKKRVVTIVIALFLLAIMFALTFFSSKGIGSLPGDSGTVDEIAHIPSGYSYDKYGDFRLNPEHPPLAKALAGLPLALMDFRGPKDDWSWEGINQWEAGWYMLYETGNDPAKVLLWSRLPMMILLLVLGLFVFKWSTERFGRKIGLATLALFAFYPDLLAHGKLVTTDVAAALGYVISIYYFDRALRERTTKGTFIAAVAFGIAQLLKFSSFLLFGILIILAVARAFLEKQEEGFGRRLWTYFKIYFWTCLVSVLIVWIVYIPFVRNTPPAIEHQVIERNLTADPRTQPLRNTLHLMENNTTTRALDHYLLGIMLVIGRVEGGNATFLMGKVAEKSIPLFFPIAWLIKTPIPIILLTLWSLTVLVIKRFKDKEDAWLAWIILTPIIVYWGFTLKGSLNIGIRHLLPTIPFVLLLIGYAISKAKLSKRGWNILFLLIIFEAYHTISYFPNYIGYFNNFVPREKRYQYMVDSSLDWGQDLLRLKKYVDDNNISDIKVDYFGGSVPSYYIPQSREWHSSYGPTTGYLAISATYYQSSKLYGPKEGKWSYEWLDQFQPQTIIGGSILVYNISADDLIKRSPKATYPITKIESPGAIRSEAKKVGL